MSRNGTVKRIQARKPGIDPGTDLQSVRATLCTDLANAKRFAKIAGPMLRHVPGWGWVRWDGRRWERDALDVVRKMAHDISDIVRVEAFHAENPDIAGALIRHAKYAGSSKAIAALLREAQPLCAARSGEFDRSLDLVNFANCTISFEQLSGDVPHAYEHAKPDYITKLIPHDWHMGARRLNWEKFLSVIFPDDELRAFVQRAVGYSLLGHIREQCFFVLYGSGANGKSVFLNTIRTLLGTDYACQADPQTFLASHNNSVRSDLARLVGVRFVVASESGAGEQINEALIKAVTGGEPIATRFLYRETFEFQPQFKLWMSTNHLPRIRGTDDAIWRRVMPIPCTVTIPEGDRDKNLAAKLLNEAEGILDWAVEGCVAYCKSGLQPPQAVLRAVGEYRLNEDYVGRFINEMIEGNPSSKEPKSLVYKCYEQWTRLLGDCPVSQRRFSELMTRRGFESARGTGNVHFWIGIKLVNDRSDPVFQKSS